MVSAALPEGTRPGLPMAATDHHARLWPGAMRRPAASARAPGGRAPNSGLSGESWARAYRAPLLVAALAAAAIALIWFAAGPALDSLGGVVEGARDHDTASGRAGATTVLVAAALLAFVGRWGSRSSPRRPLAIAGGGRLPVDALAALLRAELTAIDAVVAASARVENRHRRGVAVEVVVEVEPQALLAEVGVQARDLAVDAVARRLGLRLAAPPRVELRYGELDLRPLPSAAPGDRAAARWERGGGGAGVASGGGAAAAVVSEAVEGASDGRGEIRGRSGG